MKTVSARKVRKILRKTFKLRPASRMDGTGHEKWEDPITGYSCRPVLRRKDVPIKYLWILGREMTIKGICQNPREIIEALAI